MFTINEIAEILEGEVYGNPNIIIKNIAPINLGNFESISIIKTPNDISLIEDSKSQAFICETDFSEIYPNKTFIVMRQIDPNYLNNLFRIYRYKKYNLFNRENTSKIQDVYIGQNVKIGKNCLFMPGVKIMNGVHIGDNVCIHCNTVIKEGTKIGNDVLIDSNCSIGNFSFEYIWDGDELIRLESVGELIIKDNVEIGSNTTIDRGTIGNTIIGTGTKIDNLVQIGHEVTIGNNCLIAAQTGIAGWASIKNNVVLHGQVGIKGGIEIGNQCIVQAKSGVRKSLKPKSIVFGIPAEDRKKYYKKLAILNKLIKNYEHPPIENKSNSNLTYKLKKIFNKK